MKRRRANQHKIDYLFAILVGIYIAAVLWITLLSRLGTGYRGFLFPFQSYISVFSGNWRALVENVENLILFVPLGISLGLFKRWRFREVAVIGFCASLSIELLQALFALGTFECDDLLHNTIGTVVGYCLAEKLNIQVSIRKNLISVILVTVLISVALPFGYQAVWHRHMVKLAALHDSVDGRKNLLVLNGKSIKNNSTGITIKYLEDGSLHIYGQTDIDCFFVVSDIALPQGDYTACVLGASSHDLVKFKLAYFDDGLNKYTWFSNEIDCNTEACFNLTENTKLQIYLRVYPGFNGMANVVPVVYKKN